MASAAYSSNEVTEAWIAEWNEILQAICRTELDDHLDNFQADSMRLVELLDVGNYVMHHSASYRETYHPHYRIIHRSIFEEQILPKLNE